MTAIEDARIAVLEAASQILHARSDPARARANRHLDGALEAWASARFKERLQQVPWSEVDGEES